MKKIKLYFDRKRGKAWYQGMGSIVQHRTAQSYYLVGAEQYLGLGARMIIYTASKNIARKKLYERVKSLKGKPEEVMKRVLDHLSLCGYGLFEIKCFGKETRIELRNSSNILKHDSDKPVCYGIAGYLAGIMELITGKECQCTEESCIAKKDKVCTFSINVLPLKAMSVMCWWKSEKPPEGAEETFVDYDESKGEAIFKGVATSLINARPEHCEYQKEFQRIIGPAYKTIMYESAGKIPTEEAVSQIQGFIIKVLRIFSKRKIMEKLLVEFEQRGFGTAELADFDEKKATARFIVRNSFFFSTGDYKWKKEAVCHSLRGLFSGGSGVVFGKNLGCTETKCIAKGDPYCEFEVYPENW